MDVEALTRDPASGYLERPRVAVDAMGGDHAPEEVVRGAVDCVIAQTCLDADTELLSPDSDFQHIAQHTPLRLWRP